MDHISASKGLPISERENISGARVFDGEDMGKLLIQKWENKLKYGVNLYFV